MTRPVKYYQLMHLTLAHGKEVVRQPAVLFWGIVFPILISLGLGVAFTQKSDMVRHVAVVAKETAAVPGGSRIDAFLKAHAQKLPQGGSGDYKLVIENQQLGDTIFFFSKMNWKNAMMRLKRGKLNLILDADEAEVRYHFDPRNPDAQLTYLKLSKAVGGTPVENPRIAGNIEPLTVTGTRYIDFLVPGLIAMGVMMSCMWGISYGMIDKRAKKLLRRMVATPMRKSHFLLALMTVRITMNIIESSLLFLFACLAFDISIQGSVPALLAIFMAGNIAFGGIAIFTSSRTANTEIGNGVINAVVLPMTVLSGIFFSYHNFPEWSIAFIQKLPLTLLTDGIRSIFIEGAGFAETGPACVILTAMGVFFFSAGLKVFRWH